LNWKLSRILKELTNWLKLLWFSDKYWNKKEIHNHQNKSFVKPQIRSDDIDIKYKYEKNRLITSDAVFEMEY
jgi:hypothetical protein